MPNEFVNGKEVCFEALFATDDLVKLEIIRSPKLNGFVHAGRGKIRLLRVESDMIYCEQMRGNIVYKLKGGCVPDLHLCIARSGNHVAAIGRVLGRKYRHCVAF